MCLLARLLGEELEGALLGDVAELAQAAERLLTRRRLLLAHNLAPLVLDQILARQATLGVVGRAVENLRLATDRGHAATRHRLVCRVIRRRVVRGVHGSCLYRKSRFFSTAVKGRPGRWAGATVFSSQSSICARTGRGSNARARSSAFLDRLL